MKPVKPWPAKLLFFADKMTLRHKMARSLVLWSFAGLVVASLGVGVVTVRGPDSAGGAARRETVSRIMPVETTVLEPVSSFEQRRRYTGTIRARGGGDLSFERSGMVVEVLVDEGEAVAAGQVVRITLSEPLAVDGFWPPLAVAIAGGVGGAAILALFLVPSAYVLVMCRGRSTDSVAAQETASSEEAVQFAMPAPHAAVAVAGSGPVSFSP